MKHYLLHIPPHIKETKMIYAKRTLFYSNTMTQHNDLLLKEDWVKGLPSTWTTLVLPLSASAG